MTLLLVPVDLSLRKAEKCVVDEDRTVCKGCWVVILVNFHVWPVLPGASLLFLTLSLHCEWGREHSGFLQVLSRQVCQRLRNLSKSGCRPPGVTLKD